MARMTKEEREAKKAAEAAEAERLEQLGELFLQYDAWKAKRDEKVTAAKEAAKAALDAKLQEISDGGSEIAKAIYDLTKDDKGKPQQQMRKDGTLCTAHPYTRTLDEPEMVPELDDDGTPIYDGDGNPVMKVKKDDDNPVMKTEVVYRVKTFKQPPPARQLPV